MFPVESTYPVTHAFPLEAAPVTAPEEAHLSGPTGPRTDEGKSRTRLNAYRHGLTGQVLVFSPEEQLVYDAHCATVKDAWQPYGPREVSLVQAIADSEWRLQRASAMEHNLFIYAAKDAPEYTGIPAVDAAFCQARTWLCQSKSLALLSTYENRLQRKLEKYKAELSQLQAAREKQYQTGMERARQLLQLAKAAGKVYNPKAYFSPRPHTPESVFSEADVLYETGRAQLDSECAALSSRPARAPDMKRNEAQ